MGGDGLIVETVKIWSRSATMRLNASKSVNVVDRTTDAYLVTQLIKTARCERQEE